MLRTPPARPSRSGTVPAASARSGCRCASIGPLSTSVRRVPSSGSRSGSIIATCTVPATSAACPRPSPLLAILVRALLPGRAAADFNGAGRAVRAHRRRDRDHGDTTATLNGFVADQRPRHGVHFFRYGTGPRRSRRATPKVVARPDQSGPGRRDRRRASCRSTLVPLPSRRLRTRARASRRLRCRRDLHVAPPPRSPLRRRSRRPPRPTHRRRAVADVSATSVVVAPVKGTVLVEGPGRRRLRAPRRRGRRGSDGRGPRHAQGPGRAHDRARRRQDADRDLRARRLRRSASRRPAHGLTDIFLRGPAPACGTARATGRAAAVAKKKPKKRQLWGATRAAASARTAPTASRPSAAPRGSRPTPAAGRARP